MGARERQRRANALWLTEWLAEALELRPEMRVLDLGCGPGQWSAYLHSLGAEVVGVDLVEEFIAHARATP